MVRLLLDPAIRGLAITQRSDIETALCLFVVGIIVTELAAARNRHHHAIANEEADFVAEIYGVAELVASGAPVPRWSSACRNPN